MTFNVALIGLGKIGFEFDKGTKNISYLTHYSAIKNTKGLNLKSAIDNNKKNREEFQKHSNIKPISLNQLSNIDNNIDLFVIATPTQTHFQIIELIILFRPKLILCEKPLSLSSCETKNIISFCSSNEVDLEVNYFRRFEESALIIKDLLRNATYFRTIVFYSNGVINNGSHFIDLINFWFGNPKEINLKSNNGVLKKSFDDFDLDFEFIYEKGDVNFYSWKENFYSNYSIRIYTNETKIDYDINGYTVTRNEKIIDPNFKGFMRLKEDPIKLKNNLNEGFKPIYSNIYSKMRDNVKTDFNQINFVSETIDKLLKQL